MRQHFLILLQVAQILYSVILPCCFLNPARQRPVANDPQAVVVTLDERERVQQEIDSTEFAKMADFMKEHKIDWPVIYTDRSSYAPFGVTGIPHVVLIDRDGKVVKVKVGYSPESFKEFRATVEKLLAK